MSRRYSYRLPGLLFQHLKLKDDTFFLQRAIRQTLTIPREGRADAISRIVDQLCKRANYKGTIRVLTQVRLSEENMQLVMKLGCEYGVPSLVVSARLEWNYGNIGIAARLMHWNILELFLDDVIDGVVMRRGLVEIIITVSLPVLLYALHYLGPKIPDSGDIRDFAIWNCCGKGFDEELLDYVTANSPIPIGHWLDRWIPRVGVHISITDTLRYLVRKYPDIGWQNFTVWDFLGRIGSDIPGAQAAGKTEEIRQILLEAGCQS